MKKEIWKRIAAVIITIAICMAVALGYDSIVRVNAEPITNLYNGPSQQEVEDYFNYARAVAEGRIDSVNGEIVLSADKKANVLTNIKKAGQKLTIMEIVPYEYASIYNVFCSDKKCETIINRYGADIFNKFPDAISLNGVKQHNVRLLAGDQSNHKFSKYEYSRDHTENYIADQDHPIEVFKNEDGTYSSNIANYFIANLLSGYETTKVYDYFANQDNVEVKIVVPGLTTAEELQKMLTGADNGSNDPVDFIHIGGYATFLERYVYRNLFFDQGSFDAEGNYVIADDVYNDMRNLMFYNTLDQNKYHTNVYKKVGSNNYVEYKFSELVSQKVWFDSYSKIGAGNTDADYRSNDLTWGMVKNLMAYIFGDVNKNYLYFSMRDDGTLGASQQQRVSCVFQLYEGYNGYFKNIGDKCDSNVGKLYYLLSKTTDQKDDKNVCDIECNISHAAGHSTSTHTIYDDIETYYGSPYYFLNTADFSETDSSGNKYVNSNGVTTMAYQGNSAWPVYTFGDVYYDSRTPFEWWAHDGQHRFAFEDGSPLYFFNINGNSYEQNLFYTTTILDRRFIVYNGLIAVSGEVTENLFDSGLSSTWSGGGARGSGVYARVQDAVGPIFSQYNVVNYLLGVDESDFLTPPDAEIIEVNNSNGQMSLQNSSDANGYVTYMYDEDTDATEFKVDYKISDSNSKMIEAKVYAKYPAIVGGVATTKTVELKSYERSDIYGLEHYSDSILIDESNAELLAAYRNHSLEIVVSVTNELTLKDKKTGTDKIFNFTDVAHLYLVYRDIRDLD